MLRAMFALLLVGCVEERTDFPMATDPDPVTTVLENSGVESEEGHTPRGFQGQGVGLFAGDDLNPSFPSGDGVQIFLNVPLDGVPNEEVLSAVLSAEPPEIRGTPFETLGELVLDEMRFGSFSSALWDREPVEGGVSCVFATDADGPYSCDIGPAVQRALDDDRDAVQLRIRFDEAGDGDGEQDMVMFHLGDTNAVAPGRFSVEVSTAGSAE